jgi:hypothetical protein
MEKKSEQVFTCSQSVTAFARIGTDLTNLRVK